MFERRRQPPPGTGLQICPVCRSDYVVPVWWEEVEDDRLRLLLRCGECDTHHDLVVAGEVADRFEKDYVRVLESMAAHARPPRPRADGDPGERVRHRARPGPDRRGRLRRALAQVLIAPGRVSAQITQMFRPIRSSAQIG